MHTDSSPLPSPSVPRGGSGVLSEWSVRSCWTWEPIPAPRCLSENNHWACCHFSTLCPTADICEAELLLTRALCSTGDIHTRHTDSTDYCLPPWCCSPRLCLPARLHSLTARDCCKSCECRAWTACLVEEVQGFRRLPTALPAVLLHTVPALHHALTEAFNGPNVSPQDLVHSTCPPLTSPLHTDS